MEKQVSAKSVAKNISVSVIAQIISLAIAFILNLIVPKFIDEYQYAYWQTYVLYRNYVGVLHFGLLDGIVLRYAQYDYAELDKTKIRSQFLLMLMVNVVFAVGIVAVSQFVLSTVMCTVALFVAIMVVVKNAVTYTSYSYQMTNRIAIYAKFVIIQKLLYGAGVVLVLVLNLGQFYWICLMEVISEVLAIVLLSKNNKGMYFGKMLPRAENLAEAKDNMSAGVLLLIANWSSMLLVGTAKMVTQWKWGDLVFGKVSFAFSITSLFLTFITAISVVLFPTLKRMKKEQLPTLYQQIRAMLSPLLLLALLLYFPGCWILHKWLPNYEASLGYLGILLPSIVYTSKVSLLTNNYLKAYRKEKLMLYINVGCFVVTAITCTFAAYVLNNLEVLLLCLVGAMILRSVISEIVVMHLIQRVSYREYFIETLIVAIFIFCATRLTPMWGFGVYLLVMVVYLVYVRKSVIGILKKLLKK